jgi:pyridoxal phosphate enzyme (YggS family)
MSAIAGGNDIAVAVADVRARVAAAAARAGRDPTTVTLVAATKTVPVARLRDLLAAGVTELGENRAQELLAKAPELAAATPPPRWHFIGRLQRNKVRALSPWVACWQSVDREELGATIARHAVGSPVLVEVNIAGEPAKGGVAPIDASRLVDALGALGLRVEGLMTVPPAGEDPRPWFARLARLAVDLSLRELSMGMSDDYEVAIEEGATVVRVGRALLGPRPPVR